jgi:hypothetical protein
MPLRFLVFSPRRWAAVGHPGLLLAAFSSKRGAGVAAVEFECTLETRDLQAVADGWIPKGVSRLFRQNGDVGNAG